MILYCKKLQSIVFILLLALCWTYVNMFIFSHVHRDDNGRIYVHAHPYHKETRQGQTTPGHTHTKSELLLLGLVYKIFTSLIIAFFLFTFYPNIPAITRFAPRQPHPLRLYGVSIRRRGPPHLSPVVPVSL